MTNGSGPIDTVTRTRSQRLTFERSTYSRFLKNNPGIFEIIIVARVVGNRATATTLTLTHSSTTTQGGRGCLESSNSLQCRPPVEGRRSQRGSTARRSEVIYKTITFNDDDSHELFNETLASPTLLQVHKTKNALALRVRALMIKFPRGPSHLKLVEIIHGMVVADDGSKKMHFVDSIDVTEDEGKSSSTDLRSLQRMFSDRPCR